MNNQLSLCTHYFKVEPYKSDGFKGVCKWCGEVEDYPGEIKYEHQRYATWDERTAIEGFRIMMREQIFDKVN